MLAAVENALLPAVQAAVTGVTAQAGPVHDGPGERVAVWAQRLVLLPRPGSEDDPQSARAGARLASQEQHVASGSDRNIAVSQPGDIAEVESPPGHALIPGDDYLLSGRTVQLFKAPSKNQVVAVSLLGAPARGYVETLPCRIELALSAYAGTRDRLDALLHAGLAAVLAAGVDLPRLQAEFPGSSGVRMRLLRPVAALSGIERSAGRVDTQPFLRATAQLVVRGELETTVALGQPEPVGTIAEVVVAPDAGSKRFVEVKP
jgi:hypothetical protein